MDDHGTFLATLIETTLQARAAGAATRALETEGVELGSSGDEFSRLRAEHEVSLAYLCEALASGHAELFLDHICWRREAYVARGLSHSDLQASLTALAGELGDSLPPDDGSAIQKLLEEAQSVLGRPLETCASPIERQSPHSQLAREFLLATLEARRQDAIRLVTDAYASGVPLQELHCDVIGVTQAEVGRMWQLGEAYVAEEHLATGIAIEALTALRLQFPAPKPDARRLLVASVSGDQHDLGARLVADQFTERGWHTVFLGANMPAPDIARAVGDFRADLLAISVNLGLFVRTTAAMISEVRSSLGQASPPILVGGGPFSRSKGLWQSVGADGSAASAWEAVEVGERLVPRTD